MKAWNLALALTLVLAAGCSRPADADRLKFSHKLHADNGIACTDCHGDLARAAEVGTGRRPDHEACVGCHDKLEEDCSTCHSNPDQARALPRHATRDLVFSHELHVEAVEGDCRRCHAQVADSVEPGADRRGWTHQACMECHREQYRDVRCAACHRRMSDWKDRPFSVFNHDADFMGRHGTLARGEKNVCQHCHDEASCAACHSTLQGLTPARRFAFDVDRPLVHRGDFVSRHAIEARLDRMACYACHQSRDCSSCHQARGVSLAGASFQHPDGWMQAGSATHHGRDARKKIGLCAGCHDRGEKSNCLACHRPGGAGGNPHPGKEFGGTGLDRGRDMPCRLCH